MSTRAWNALYTSDITLHDLASDRKNEILTKMKNVGKTTEESINNINFIELEKNVIRDQNKKIKICEDKRENIERRKAYVLEGKNIEQEVSAIGDPIIDEIDSEIQNVLNIDIKYRNAYDVAYKNYLENQNIFDENQIIPANILGETSKEIVDKENVLLEDKMKIKKKKQQELDSLRIQVEKQTEKKSRINRLVQGKDKEEK